MVDYQVFISYRRDGGEYLAGRISDKLREKYGMESVNMREMVDILEGR